MGDEPRIRPKLTLKSAPAPTALQGARMRADLLLVEKGLVRNRHRAANEIEAGHVFAGDVKIERPGDMVDVATPLSLKQRHNSYVSRGGLKLAHALDHFGIVVKGKICVDIGAGTGGFSQVLAERGAARVYAIDLDEGKLGAALRENPVVVALENTDAKTLSRRHIPEHVDLVVVDAGDVPVTHVIGAALALTGSGGQLVALVSPDVEAGRKRPQRGRGPAAPQTASGLTPREVSARLDAFLKSSAGFSVTGMSESAVKGPGQAREFFIAARRV